MHTVRDIIDRGAKAHPDKIFLTSAHNGKSLSWLELRDHCHEINALLNQQGVDSGAKVAFLLDNGYWTTLLLLGVMYSGRVVLALNALSGKESLSYVIEHSDSELLFISPHYQQQYSQVISALDSAIKLVETDEDAGPTLSVDTPLPIENHLPEQGAYRQGVEPDFGQEPTGVDGQDEKSGQLGRPFRVAASGEHVAARQDQGGHDDGEHEHPEEQGDGIGKGTDGKCDMFNFVHGMDGCWLKVQFICQIC